MTTSVKRMRAPIGDDIFQRHSILTTIAVVLALIVSVSVGVVVLLSTGHRDLAESSYQWPAFIGYGLLTLVLATVFTALHMWRVIGLRLPLRWWPYAPVLLILALQLGTSDFSLLEWFAFNSIQGCWGIHFRFEAVESLG